MNHRTTTHPHGGAASVWPRPAIGLGLLLFVAFSGACLGAFRVEWTRTDSTGLHLYQEGRAWISLNLRFIPILGDRIDAAWDTSWFNRYTAHVPGIVNGGLSALFVWLALSMAAAWQNALLFGLALRRIAIRFAPLILYLPLTGAKSHFDTLYFHAALLIPFGISAFSLAGAVRRTRGEALPTGGRAGNEETTWGFLPLALIWIVAIVRFVDWFHIASLRHNHFHSHGYDLALMSHVLTNFVRGDGLVSSLIVSGGSFLGHHFSPILYLLCPFWFFCPNPEVLILAQAAAVAFAAVPLYLFARTFLGSPWTAAGLAMTYLYFPGLSEGMYFDFHAICFAPILLFWLAYETGRPDRNRFWIPALLLFTVQENVVLYVLVFAIYLLFQPPLRRRGWMLLGASVVAGGLIFGVFQPLLRPEGDLGYGFVHRYKDFIPEGEPGSWGVSRLAVGVLTNPATVIQKIFNAEAWSIYRLHWGGALFAPLWNPLCWILLAPCLENILSSEEMLRVWGNHYAFGPLALSSIAMVGAFGLWRRFPRCSKGSVPLAWLLVFSSMFWAMRRSQLPFSIFMISVFYSSDIEPPQMREALLAEIPYGSSVAAQTHLLPHLTHQKELYLVPPGRPHVPIDTTRPVENMLAFDVVIPNVPWPDYIVYNPEVKDDLWYNLWFYSSEWVEETRMWLDWLGATGRYTQTYPREGLDPEQTLPLVVLRRTDLSE